MKIEEIKPGEFYKTRGNHKVRIYANDGGEGVNIHGAVYLKAGGGFDWFPESWNVDGKVYDSKQHDLDILSPWHEKPEVDWSAMPKWAKFAAMNIKLVWYFYWAEEPNLTDVHFYNNGDCARIPDEYAPKNYTGPWEESKVKRPEGV